jgi:feruloyl-CoA synthase
MSRPRDHSTAATRGRGVRPVRLAPIATIVRFDADGSVYLRSPAPLGSYPTRITEPLEYWADHAPDRIFLAQRDARGAWRAVTYRQARAKVRALAQSLLDRGLSSDRPVAILSGNGIEHGLLALACMYAGVLYSPVAPAYSLQAREYTALRHVIGLLRPRLVFAAEGDQYERALRSVLSPDIELVVVARPSGALRATPFAELEHATATTALDEARDAVGPDTIAKILFTSGSTGQPKGVINTQRMLCSNQQMLRSVLAFLTDEPPILCDWLPWNHTAGGNHNFGLVLFNGGTLYIDEGRPTPAGIEATVRNLRDVAVTAHFGVPRSYEMLLPYLRADEPLRRRFFSRLKLLFYAAAGLSQPFFDELREMAVQTCGEEILWMTGFGATETAPFALSTGSDGASSGVIGLPAPGLELKLAPIGSKMEARLRGPSITPGYWRQDALTRAAFDDEGFYRLGDAMRFVDPGDPAKGLLFDGRFAEDFKLSSGTWVSVGPLRGKILAAAEGYAQDVVIAGPDRAFLSALIFPNIGLCRELCPDLGGDAPVRTVLDRPEVRARLRGGLDDLARDSTGSSTLVARAVLLDEPASIDAGEITDKGSINQKAVLENRSALVEELYAPSASPRVICVSAPQATNGARGT